MATRRSRRKFINELPKKFRLTKSQARRDDEGHFRVPRKRKKKRRFMR